MGFLHLDRLHIFSVKSLCNSLILHQFNQSGTTLTSGQTFSYHLPLLPAFTFHRLIQMCAIRIHIDYQVFFLYIFNKSSFFASDVIIKLAKTKNRKIRIKKIP